MGKPIGVAEQAMNFTAARRNMVDSQVRPNGITDGRIIDAMLEVPREDFVSQRDRSLAYMDAAVALSAQRALIPAMAFARLLQAAEIHVDDKLLVIGCGTGYGAAVATRIAAYVVGLESDADLLRLARANLDGQARLSLVEGELAGGHAAGAPYNVIVIEGQVGVVPEAITRQLAEGGRIVAIVGNGRVSAIRIGTVKDGGISWRRGPDCTAPALAQFMVAAPEFVF